MNSRFPSPLRLVLLLFVTVLAPAAVISGCEEPETRYETVRLGDEDFELELAVTRAEHRQGMAGREQVAADEGMLFLFERARVRSFWMKGCLIPLDIIYLDGSRRIVQTHTMPAPEPGTADRDLISYSSYYPAQFVIEVKAGTVERLGLSEGDRINLPLERLKRVAAGVDENEEG